MRLSQIFEEPLGVTRIAGRCAYNISEEEDLTSLDSVAFHLDQRAQLSMSSNHVFPRGFPQDFSILIVTRCNPSTYYNIKTNSIFVMTFLL